MKFWKTSFTTRVASAFLLLSLLSVAVVGGVAFVRAREALQRAAYDRLSVAATLKEQEIVRWFESCERDFLLIRQFPDVQRSLQQILTHSPQSPTYQAAYDQLIRYFAEYSSIKTQFAEILLLDRSNRIILSTHAAHEGQYEIATNLTYFETVQPGETFTPVFYISAKTGKPAITYAAPIRDRNGRRQGVILADLNLNRIDQIVSERTGLGETGETYVVGSLSNRNSFISRASFEAQSSLENLSSQGIEQVMDGISGAGLYPNYANVPVIGVYRWLDNQNVALLVEMSQAEALSSPARKLAFSIMIVGLGSVGILLAGVSQLARQLKRSREQLEDYSHQVEKKAEEANTANRAKSQFLANMSHELRTPLNAILGFSQLMTRDPSCSDTQLESLSIISRSGEHLLTLIDDVLSMSKIEAGLTTLNLTSFDLYSLLDALETMLRVKADAQGLQLVFQRSPAVPHYVKTDEGKLRQVLINLIGNAIKFTAKGRVELKVEANKNAPAKDFVSASPGEEAAKAAPPNSKFKVQNSKLLSPASPPAPYCLHFEVTDTGPGIAPNELDQLFNPFVQTTTGQKSQQGTGLGLSISRSFVQLMGGDITVHSVLDQGSIFAFDIDVCLAETADVQPRSQNRRIIGLAPDQPVYRLLIVEDRWENRQLLLRTLQPLGFEICEAVNGQEGLDLWTIWQPHLIWMDMRMPVMDGYEATRRIRQIEQERQGKKGRGEGGDGRDGGDRGEGGEREEGKGQAIKRKLTSAETRWLEQDASQNLKTSPPRLLSPAARASATPTKIIAITASAFEEQQAQILAAGCDDFVRKPFREEVIFNKLVTHLGVQFLYASPAPAAAIASSSSLTAEQLTTLPPDWISELYTAAVRVDADWIERLIGQLPENQADLAQQLRELIDRFDFDTIIELTQEKADANAIHEYTQS
ncbi:hybrid sensor histidine kinase/response regulator [Almyronema epifaneia]|uniref:histidine kinase n=1 Tax=Almyronema epifaneia S1 TaxID=2991925 RepID=A0ABW6IB44_9CYAN